jgi:hypothetical protein
VTVRPETTNSMPILFSTHRPGWWQKSLNGGRDRLRSGRGRGLKAQRTV